MASCRYCADKLTADGKALTGMPCIAGHDHAPWPELAYREAPSDIPGVSRMVLVTRDN